MEKSKFLHVTCPRCKRKKTVFGKASMNVKCEDCNYLLLKPQGGKAKIRALIKKVLWR